MAKRTDPPRTYGMADPSNKQPRPEQGLRGEKATPRRGGTGLLREEQAEGRRIEVEETSGVAFAEATGAVPLDRDSPPPRDRPVTVGSLMIAVGGGALLGALWGLLRRRPGGVPPVHEGPAAFTRPVTPPENFDQTREAGPENIRDLPEGADWDVVDETSDESFPASDPPGCY